MRVFACFLVTNIVSGYEGIVWVFACFLVTNVKFVMRG